MHAAFLIAYLVILLCLGAIKARKVKTQEDFALAGRGLSGAGRKFSLATEIFETT